MGMIGNQIAAGQALTIANDSFNGDGSTVAFTLSQTVSSVNDIEVLVDNVQQSPYDSSYSVSGTTLTFSGAPSAGTNNVYVIYNASRHITTQQVIPDDGSVTHSKFHTNALDPIKLSGNNVGIGTSSPSNFGGSTLQVNHASSYSSVLASSGAYTMQFMASQTNGVTNMGSRSNHPVSITTNDTPKLTIDTSGRVTVPNQPGFSVRQLAQNGIDCSSGGYVAFRNIHTQHFNTGNHFDSSTGRFTAPVTGNYIVGATVRYDAFSGSYFYASIYKNGNFYARDLKQQTGAYLHASVHTIVNMASGDYVYIELQNSGDSSINLDNDCNFYGYLLG